MKVYCVFGVEYHVGRELLGIYSTHEKAVERIEKGSFKYAEHCNQLVNTGYDRVIIEPFELDTDIGEILHG